MVFEIVPLEGIWWNGQIPLNDTTSNTFHRYNFKHLGMQSLVDNQAWNANNVDS